MKASTPASNRAIRVAALAAGLMIAQQVASKATRDTLFLLNFPVTVRPALFAAGALVSVIFVLGASRLFGTRGPARVVPPAFALSGLLFLAEWGVSRIAPRPVAIAVYLHVAAFGAVLISGFWSLFNELFDPRTAKRRVGSIGAAAALGGILGGLLAERVGSLVSVSSMLPFLGAMHLGCAGLVRLLGASPRLPGEGARAEPRPVARSPFRALADAPFLRHLATVVVLAAIAAGVLDYVFQSRVQATFGRGHELIRLFAFFYMGISVLTFLAQRFIAPLALRTLQVAPTLAMLPLGVIVVSSAAFAFPTLATAGLAWLVEAVLHSSLFRSAYEVLFVPVPERQKRAAKPLIDVGFERLGDATSAAVVAASLLVAGALGAPRVLLGAAIVVAAACAWFARRLQSGYESVLAARLEPEPALSSDEDPLTISTVLETVRIQKVPAPAPGRAGAPTPTPRPLQQTQLITGVMRRRGVPASEATPVSEPIRPSEPPVRHPSSRDPSTQAGIFPRVSILSPADPLVEKISALRSRDPARARPVLAAQEPLPSALVPHAIPLIAMDELATDAMIALRAAAPRAVGVLVDALLDPGNEFDVRRRLPRVLSAHPSARAIEGLLHGLSDKRFEVRYECGRALDRIHLKAPELAIEGQRVLDAVEHEMTVDRVVWESQRALDEQESAAEDTESGLRLDGFIRRRSNRSLEHVFTLLMLIYPQKPLRVAFLGLQTDDSTLQGTALEYLENALPPRIRDRLWPFLTDERPRRREARPREEVLDDLMRSNESIVIHLDELKRRQRAT